MKAAEDYLLLLLHAQVIAAVKHILSATPNISVENLVQSIVDLVVFPRITDTQCATQYNDKVHCYAVKLLTLSFMWHGFHDACKEADGERILRYWKFLLVAFKSTNHRNYAPKRLSTFYCSTTTYFLKGKNISFFGVVALTLQDVKGEYNL